MRKDVIQQRFRRRIKDDSDGNNITTNTQNFISSIMQFPSSTFSLFDNTNSALQARNQTASL